MFTRPLLGLLALFTFSCSSAGRDAPAVGTTDCETAYNSDSQSVAAKIGFNEELLRTKTGVVTLENGGESLITRAWLCNNARNSIDIQYYIFSRDNTGLIASDFLVRAADRGVKVRLLIDDITVEAGSKEIHSLDSHKNIEIKVYNPGVKLGKPSVRLKKIVQQAGKLHRRMHNKTITIDGQFSITGGRNIADEYFDFDKKYNFRDRDVLLIGKAVAQVTRSFEEFWTDTLSMSFSELVNENKKKFRDPHRFEKLHIYACDPENFSPQLREKIKQFPSELKKLENTQQLLWVNNVNFVSDEPGKNRNRKERLGGTSTDSLIALVQNAKAYIDIHSSYLILTDKGKRLFAEAVKRGVKVRILTNSLAATDNYEAFSGYQRDRKKILETGVEIYEFKPDARVRFDLMMPEAQAAMSYTPVYGLHSKSMIVDGHVTVVGSFNLDPRSADYNTECIAIIRSAEVTANVGKYMDREFLPENAWRVTPEWNPDGEAGPWKRIKSQSRKVIPKKIL